jgi:hypothetical protein
LVAEKQVERQRKKQVSPLRCASVEMTDLWWVWAENEQPQKQKQILCEDDKPENKGDG